MCRGDESEKFQLTTEDRTLDCEDPVWICWNSTGALKGSKDSTSGEFFTVWSLYDKALKHSQNIHKIQTVTTMETSTVHSIHSAIREILASVFLIYK